MRTNETSVSTRKQQFQHSGKAINDKVRLYWRIGHALLEAKQKGSDPFVAIEAIISWDAFTQSVTEAEKLSQPEDCDYLHRIGARYAQIRQDRRVEKRKFRPLRLFTSA